MINDEQYGGLSGTLDVVFRQITHSSSDKEAEAESVESWKLELMGAHALYTHSPEKLRYEAVVYWPVTQHVVLSFPFA
jgi:hypothetical protein